MPGTTGSKQARNFTFTDFELSDKESAFIEYPDEIRAIAWALEVCPSTQREHHQGYIQTIKRARYSKVQKLLKSPTAHIEAMKGSIMDNEIYCEKSGNLTQLGRFIRTGQRTDIEGAAALLKGGSKLSDILNDDAKLFAKHHRALRAMKEIYDKENRKGDRVVDVTVLVGSTGTGKSHQVMCNDDVFVLDAGASKDFLFDGYDGESILLIDDYNGWIKYAFLLRILDKYRLSLNVKHGKTWANWNQVFITSNMRPASWYPSGCTDSLKRRVTRVFEVVENDGFKGVNIPKSNDWAFDRTLGTEYDIMAYAP